MTLSASAGSVTEGGTITYTASVNNPVTGSDLIVTLTGGVTITIPVGSSSANSTAVATRSDEAYLQAPTPSPRPSLAPAAATLKR
ncbi:MAG: hypothetical protein IPO38_03520 [Rhodocyclaceae bacterium]|nr:hypothetical protein [Rhodocyclaceae bacterium]